MVLHYSAAPVHAAFTQPDELLVRASGPHVIVCLHTDTPHTDHRPTHTPPSRPAPPPHQTIALQTPITTLAISAHTVGRSVGDPAPLPSVGRWSCALHEQFVQKHGGCTRLYVVVSNWPLTSYCLAHTDRSPPHVLNVSKPPTPRPLLGSLLTASLQRAYSSVGPSLYEDFTHVLLLVPAKVGHERGGGEETVTT